jgi:microcompartment protein CcmL/EutN
MIDSLGILEVAGFVPAMAALDAMEKASGVRVVQTELNDGGGVVLKVTGPVDAVRTAIEAGRETADRMKGRPMATVIPRPDPAAYEKAHLSKIETSALTNSPTVKNPNYPDSTASRSEVPMAAATPSYALGFIETQGFVAVFEAIDSACKAANVEVLGKEKLGGGYITVIVKGDVAAVKAAVEAGTAKVEGLGKLIAGHVIARPSAAVLALLPK